MGGKANHEVISELISLLAEPLRYEHSLQARPERSMRGRDICYRRRDMAAGWNRLRAQQTWTNAGLNEAHQQQLWDHFFFHVQRDPGQWLLCHHAALLSVHLELILLSMMVVDSLRLLLVPFTLHSAVSFYWALGNTFCMIYQLFLVFALVEGVCSLCAIIHCPGHDCHQSLLYPPLDLVILLPVLVWTLSFFISLPLRIFARQVCWWTSASACPLSSTSTR